MGAIPHHEASRETESPLLCYLMAFLVSSALLGVQDHRGMGTRFSSCPGSELRVAPGF